MGGRRGKRMCGRSSALGRPRCQARTCCDSQAVENSQLAGDQVGSIAPVLPGARLTVTCSEPARRVAFLSGHVDDDNEGVDILGGVAGGQRRRTRPATFHLGKRIRRTR